MTAEQRRLAAIVSADVAGYSRLMGREHRKEGLEPALARYGGRRRRSWCRAA